MHAFCLFIENVFLQIPDKPGHLRDYSVGFGAPPPVNGIKVLQLRLRRVIEGVLYFIFLEKSGEPHGLPPAEPVAGGGGQKKRGRPRRFQREIRDLYACGEPFMNCAVSAIR